MNKKTFILSFFSLVFLMSCVLSENPITPPKKAKIKDKILGEWISEKDNNDIIIITKNKRKKYYHIKANNDNDIDDTIGFLSKVRGRYFLNAEYIDDDNANDTKTYYLFTEILIEKKRIGISKLDDKFFFDAAKNSLIDAKKEDGSEDILIIKSPSKELYKLFKNYVKTHKNPEVNWYTRKKSNK